MEAHQRLDRVLLAMREDLYCQQQPLKQREACRPDEMKPCASRANPAQRAALITWCFLTTNRNALQASGFTTPPPDNPSFHWLYSCAQVMDDYTTPVQPR